MNILLKQQRGENQYGQAQKPRVRWLVVLSFAALVVLGVFLCVHVFPLALIREWSIFSLLAVLNGIASVWWCSFVGRTLTNKQDVVIGTVGFFILAGWCVLLFAFLVLIGVIGS
jgi:hypothetical protein